MAMVRMSMHGPSEAAFNAALKKAGSTAEERKDGLMHDVAVSVQEAGAVIVRTIETSGAGMPYKWEPHTPRRFKTGHMYDTAGRRTGYEVLKRDDNKGKFLARVGFTGADADYIKYQEEGTSKLRGMMALPMSKQVFLNGMAGKGFS